MNPLMIALLLGTAGAGPAWDILKAYFPKLSMQGRMLENAKTEQQSIRQASSMLAGADRREAQRTSDIQAAMLPALLRLQSESNVGDIRTGMMGALDGITRQTGVLPPALASSTSISTILGMLD